MVVIENLEPSIITDRIREIQQSFRQLADIILQLFTVANSIIVQHLATSSLVICQQ